MSQSEISIRPWELSDAESLYEAVRESTEEVGAWLAWCHPGYSIEESRDWIDYCIDNRAEGREFNFAIVDTSDRLLGGCGLNRIQHDHRVANLGYWVRSGAAGRGVATAATVQVAEFAFRHTNLNRLEIFASTRNIGSQRVAEHAGARREAVVSSRLCVGGEAHDAVQFAFIRGEVRAVQDGSE